MLTLATVSPTLPTHDFKDCTVKTCRCRGGSSPRQSAPNRRCPTLSRFGVISTSVPPGRSTRPHSRRSAMGSCTCSMTWESTMASNDSSGYDASSSMPSRTSNPLPRAAAAATGSGSTPSTCHPRSFMRRRNSPLPQPTSRRRRPAPGGRPATLNTALSRTTGTRSDRRPSSVTPSEARGTPYPSRFARTASAASRNQPATRCRARSSAFADGTTE